MITKFSVADIPDGINLEELYVLDTGVLNAFAVSERQLAEYKRLYKRYSESRVKIRNVILSGNFRNGAITPHVYAELEGICRHEKCEDKRKYESHIAQLVSNPNCRLYQIGIPESIISRLPDDVKHLHIGERAIIAASLTARIPTIVTDDDAVFSIRKRLQNMYDKKREKGKRLEIMDSNNLVYVLKL